MEPFNRRLDEAIARKTRREDNHGRNRFHAHQDRNRFITRFVLNANRARLQCLNYQAPKLWLDKHAEQRTKAGMTKWREPSISQRLAGIQ